MLSYIQAFLEQSHGRWEKTGEEGVENMGSTSWRLELIRPSPSSATSSPRTWVVTCWAWTTSVISSLTFTEHRLCGGHRVLGDHGAVKDAALCCLGV